jgi:DNA-binding response OmpR family regulator
MKILLLEDDYLYRISIKEFLEDLSFEVYDFEDGQEALDALYEKSYDLLILDVRVPNIDGFEILDTIRASRITTPTIILTSLTDITSLSKGYELGCNDYLKKPFDMLELKYRIEQLIKGKCFHSREDLLQLCDIYSFDITKEILYKDGKAVDLTQKETELVSCLIQNRGMYLSLTSLHDRIWYNKEISYADIRMCVKRIRDKTDQNFIKNKRFIGYKIDK